MNSSRGDSTKSIDDTQPWVIYLLDVCYLFLTVYCLFNVYHLWVSRRLQKNKMLAAFYFFAVLTLLCKLYIHFYNLFRPCGYLHDKPDLHVSPLRVSGEAPWERWHLPGVRATAHIHIHHHGQYHPSIYHRVDCLESASKEWCSCWTEREDNQTV